MRKRSVKRDLAGEHDLGELVAAEVVGAEPVLERRAHGPDRQVLVVLRVGSEPRRAEAGEDHQGQHNGGHDRHAMADEAAPEQLPLRADDGFLVDELRASTGLDRLSGDVEQLPVRQRRHANRILGSRAP
jgi:hypothetical protein